jgi:ribosomal protein S18 acetylase RimI-like enzyme
MTSSAPPSGPRPARFPRDVPRITELVELCFHDVLDYSSRRMLRDVRAVAALGGAAWRLSRLAGIVRPEEWVAGSVWEEEGRLTGNVTLTRRSAEPDAWLISNVAVHPDCRRRGIARGLVEYALGMVRANGGRRVYLQVDETNESAVRIYGEIGFQHIGGRIAWLRARAELNQPPMEEAGAPRCTFAARKRNEWAEEYALWKDVSPFGTAWNTPLSERAFRPSLQKNLAGLLAGEVERHFLARCAGRVEASLLAFGRWSGWEGALVQREGLRGRVEAGLLNAAWNVFPPEQNVLLETTPEVSEDSLIKLGFQKRRTFIWMRYTFNGGAL